MSAHALPRITPEEYLAIERAAEFRSEYYGGKMYAMAGASHGHVLIVLNLGAELRQALKGRPCEVYPIDMRLRVSPKGLFTYPDLMVVCGAPVFAGDRKDTVTNPVLIIEVLSKSTEAHDRGFKFAQYRTVESLQEYVLVSQTEPRIERFRRQPNNQWILNESVGMDAALSLESIDCQIPMAEIYDKVEFTVETIEEMP
jgi:Uma2 family endonuclease